MKKIIISLVLLLLVTYGCKNIMKNYPSHIIELCKTAGKLECKKDCVDGFGATAYYDSTNQNFSKIGGIHLSEEQEYASFAIHSTSVCKSKFSSCYNMFEIRTDNKFKEVSCEEFFMAIEDKNKLCNGCIDTVGTGCC